MQDSTTTSDHKAKTPCIGICSTTSLGDVVCRGCKRYADEVIQWNGYDEVSKLAVLKRVEKLNTQILENKFRIFSSRNLQLGLTQLHIPFDPSLSSYCWLHNLLKKGNKRVEQLNDCGVYVLEEFAHLPFWELIEMIERELLELSTAHYERYLKQG